MDLGLLNKTVLVSASSKGIGKAIAAAFVQEGANVVICSRSLSDIEKTASELMQYSKGKVLPLQCNVDSHEQILETVRITKEQFGSIDILVNNCGGPSAGFFEELSEEKWNGAYNQVLLSAKRFIEAVLPSMKENKWGRIINITSISVHQPIDNLILSNSFRAAVTGMSKTLSTQLARFNITVNNVAPGFTLTERITELAKNRASVAGKTIEEVIRDMTKEIPAGRMATTEEIAGAVLYFASNQAAYTTGNSLHIDGGLVKGLF
ncbi:MAG: SDR family oxidoreductase [Ignavibacteriaceae bacterium]|nr:SDR family oxidoreductase [Ignavibacteriaceae bacterium]